MMPLIDCLINGTKYKENGKTISIEGERSEQSLFFRIDDCYIRSESKKCDLLVIYSDSEWKFIVLVELKGKKVEEAVKQFEETVQNERFKYIFNENLCGHCRNDKCVKLFVVVHSSGISSISDLKERIKQKYGFILEAKPENCDLKEMIGRYKRIMALANETKKRKRKGRKKK